MKANELRIGNWVQYQDFESPVQYHCIDGCNIERLWLDHDNDYYEPIPLTPEILKKCGFVLHNNNLRISLENVYLDLDYDGDNNWNLFVRQPDNMRKGLEDTILLPLQYIYLHQLQNLYFALTGEELTVNLSEPVSLSA